MRDYLCRANFAAHDFEALARAGNFRFPEDHGQAASILAIARVQRDMEAVQVLSLPFCHTLEAEALGAVIDLGDEHFGPRVRQYRYQSFEDLEQLLPFKLDKGRLAEFILAAQEATAAGETVLFELNGPLTILSSLLEAGQVYKAMRKKPERLTQILSFLAEEELHLADRLLEVGVKIFSYADSVGGVNILGPKLALWMVEQHTLPFVRALQRHCGERALIHLCPKIAFSLVDSAHAHFVEIPLQPGLRYEEALLGADRRYLGGDRCLQNLSRPCPSLNMLELGDFHNLNS